MGQDPGDICALSPSITKHMALPAYPNLDGVLGRVTVILQVRVVADLVRDGKERSVNGKATLSLDVWETQSYLSCSRAWTVSSDDNIGPDLLAVCSPHARLRRSFQEVIGGFADIHVDTDLSGIVDHNLMHSATVACKLTLLVLGAFVPGVPVHRLAIIFLDLHTFGIGDTDFQQSLCQYAASPSLDDAASVGKEVDDV